MPPARNGRPHITCPICLQDAGLPPTLLREAYLDLIHIIWRLYRVCKLVHGDLSEYNLLYHARQVCCAC